MEKIARAICLPDMVEIRINLTANQTIDNRLLGRAAKSANPFVRTRKRLRIGYNLEPFSTTSAFVEINPLAWMKSLCDEIPLTRG